MAKKLFIIPALLIAVIGVFAFSMMAAPGMDNPDSISIEYNSNVCKTVTRADGTVEATECNHNLLYDTGKELIELYLGNGSSGNADWIGLCNATSACGEPVADSSEAYTALTGGLSRTQGEYSSVDGSDGNWTISNKFTATGSVSTNVTHLETSAGVEFAGNSFTLVSLENDDELSIEWNIWVSAP